MSRSVFRALLLLAAWPALAQTDPDPPSGQGLGFEIGRSSIDTNRLGYQRGRLGYDLGRTIKSHARIPPARRPVQVPPMRPVVPAVDGEPKVSP